MADDKVARKKSASKVCPKCSTEFVPGNGCPECARIKNLARAKAKYDSDPKLAREKLRAYRAANKERFRDGRDEPENVLPACRSCNSSKGAKLVTEWRRAQKLLTPAMYERLSRFTEDYFKKAA
jgi:hypothetical protein